MANPLRQQTIRKLALAIAERQSKLGAFAKKDRILWPIRDNVYGYIALQGNALTSNPIHVILNIGVSFRPEELIIQRALKLRPFSEWTPSKSVVCGNSTLGYPLPDVALGSDSFDIFERKFEPLFHEHILEKVEGFSDDNQLIEELYQTFHQGGGKAQRLIVFLLARGRREDAISIAEKFAMLPISKGRETSLLEFYEVASNLIRKEW